MKKEIRITNNLDEITELSTFVEEFCTELSLSPALTMHINLALEEAVSNIIMYAYPDNKQQEIVLKASSADGELVFLLSDKGISFDPTHVADVDFSIPIEERGIGGLGIFLIRRIMNEVSYQRLDGENLLTMKKTLE